MERQTIGDPRRISAVALGLINFVNDSLDGWTTLEGEEEPRTVSELDVDAWHLTFWGRQPLRKGLLWGEASEQAGSYAFTHAVEICRRDEQVFDLADADALRDALFHVLSFAKGRLVGLALPTAYDEAGAAVAVRWETTIADPWTQPLSWFEGSLFGGLAGLLDRYVRLSGDEFWRLVLRRLVRMVISANEPNPVDVSIATAVAALELLAWSAESAGFVPALPSDASAADRIRRFLEWAGISLAVPVELQALADRAATRHDPADAPAVLAGLRNRLVHPPKKPRQLDWPDGAVMREAWRLALEFAELGILRLLDYQGNYRHRRHFRGQWVGATEPVPWARF
ncbi:hypothetical protein [Desertimonas flava]|uniref:hypothetical protein n=1 Tax=Desertimonas flava TaxID=2064846 RepID=UPI000E34A202|nr:hypothetical protein [Desertimonas flava]